MGRNKVGTLGITEDELSSISSWEDSMRSMAAEALVPVFYSKLKNNQTEKTNCIEDDDSNIRNVQSISGKFMDPEKALKKLLRRYQKNISLENATSTTFEERRASRKMLADLVLGTSIMRLLYFHTLLNYTSHYNLFEIEEPIMGVSGCSHQYRCRHDATFSEENRLKITRAMVDMHAENNELQYGTGMNLTGTFMNSTHQISIFYSLPIFLIKMLIEQYGEKATEEIATVFNEPGPIMIRRNSIKCHSDKELCERLWNNDSITATPLFSMNYSDASRKCGSSFVSIDPFEGCIRLVENSVWSPSKKSIWSLDAWKDGWFEVQDTGSQFIVKATEARRGDVVVDYCAGNGGKTFALASQMHRDEDTNNEDDLNTYEGLIVAHDIAKDRLRQLRGSFERIGLDSSDLNPSNVKVGTTLEPDIVLEKGMADIVLVDAPCSSIGALRRRPSQRFKLKEDEIKNEFPAVQIEILKEGSELVKEGGRLVYATCSLSHYENQDVVDAFENSVDFSKWERWNFEGDSNLGGLNHCRALLPNEGDYDGFFIARWKRTESS